MSWDILDMYILIISELFFHFSIKKNWLLVYPSSDSMGSLGGLNDVAAMFDYPRENHQNIILVFKPGLTCFFWSKMVAVMGYHGIFVGMHLVFEKVANV